ncbi:hypothetical protein [Caldiplasma sukawensis]
MVCGDCELTKYGSTVFNENRGSGFIHSSTQLKSSASSGIAGAEHYGTLGEAWGNTKLDRHNVMEGEIV